MAKRPGWRQAGTYKVKTGRVGKKVFRDSTGRLRQKATGRFAKEGRAARIVKLSVDESYKSSQYGMVEATYKAKVPARFPRHQVGQMIDAAFDTLKHKGHKALPKRKGKDQVRFFVYLEGNAIDDKTGKRVRAGATLKSWNRSPEEARREGRDRLRALLEGGALSSDPHKTTGSGRQRMKQGPDTIYVTAVYGPDTPVPGLDTIKVGPWYQPGHKPKPPKRKRKPKVKRRK